MRAARSKDDTCKYEVRRGHRVPPDREIGLRARGLAGKVRGSRTVHGAIVVSDGEHNGIQLLIATTIVGDGERNELAS